MRIRYMGPVFLLSLAAFFVTLVFNETKGEAKTAAATVKNSVDMEFVYISPGTFMMGSPKGETGRDEGENQHQVTLTKGFYMGVTEVTQGQWQKVMGTNPSTFKDCGDECPVETVTWKDVQEFIKKLNEMDKEAVYRLPTEAEWEYAARAGSPSAFSWGDKADCSKMNYGNSGAESGGPCNEYVQKRKLAPDSPAPVKSYPPNAWGLYDMHGNVWEWCQDWYGDYPSEPVIDPKGPTSGTDRVGRGGAFFREAAYCRSATRYIFTPAYGYDCVGFRLVRIP